MEERRGGAAAVIRGCRARRELYVRFSFYKKKVNRGFIPGH
jgi:hypothetical protein